MRVKGRWILLAVLVLGAAGTYVWRRTATPEARQDT